MNRIIIKDEGPGCVFPFHGNKFGGIPSTTIILLLHFGHAILVLSMWSIYGMTQLLTWELALLALLKKRFKGTLRKCTMIRELSY